MKRRGAGKGHWTSSAMELGGFLTEHNEDVKSRWKRVCSRSRMGQSIYTLQDG